MEQVPTHGRFHPTGTTGSDYKVSVQSISQPAIRDTSNTVFTLTPAGTAPAITVTSPNGGENWQRGTSHTVTWSYTGNPGSTVKIVLVKAGAEVGTIIASTPTGSGGTGSYTWAISPTGSTGSDYKVSVQSVSQPTVKDTSDNVFTLTPAGTATPTITVTSPNGGETWQRGTSHAVTWRYTGSPGSAVKIIYVMNADGTEQKRLTTNTFGDGYPTWSPDGMKIAFTSTRYANVDIYVMNADGIGQTRLTTDAAIDTQPSWSSDGTKIAFASSRSTDWGDLNIYVMNADGTGQTRLTTNTHDDFEPDWSPDGTKIAFASFRDDNAEIYVMNADGTGQKRLTTNAVHDSQPSWSPDGMKIAFVSSNGYKDIYVMNKDGTVADSTHN